jgi:two-component system LytT family response regulator
METLPQRILIVDDEPFAILALEELLEDIPDIEVIGTCSNAVEALDNISALQPDLILLDINMPVISGLELLNLIDPELNFKIIFVTAHDEFALQAFEANAIDYLMKPVEKDRLQRSIDKAQSFIASEKLYSDHKPQKIPVSQLGKIHMLNCEDIIYSQVEAAGLRIYCGSNGYNGKCTLATLESLCDKFLRLSRTVLINTDYIDMVSPEGRSVEVSLSTGQQFVASRRASTKLRHFLLD